MNRKIVLGALAGPAIVWAGLVVFGRKPLDSAGNFLAGQGLVVKTRFGLAIEAAAAGALSAWLIR